MEKRTLKVLAMLFFMSVIISLFAAVSISAATSGTFSAEGASVNWSYDAQSSTLTISGTGDMASASLQSVAPWYEYRTSVQKVVVKSGVTGIGGYAFRDFSALTSVSIASSVKSIGDYAFTRCTSLPSITIPSGVKSIGAGAFSFCDALASVSVSTGLESIGAQAFIYCGNIGSISVSSGNATYYSAGNCLIERQTKTVVLGCQSSVLPSDIRAIGDYAFHYCLGLSSIDFPSTLETVGKNAFQYCSALTSISLPDTTTYVGDRAFMGCLALESAKLSSSLTIINPYVFCNCPSLSDLAIPPMMLSIGTNAFYFCSGLTEVELPALLGSLGGNAFNGCTGLQKVVFLSTTTSIANSSITAGATICGISGSSADKFATKQGFTFEAFEGGTTEDGLSWAISPRGDLVISGAGDMLDYAAGSAPWYDLASKITSVKIGIGVSRIGSYAFYGCTSVTKLTMSSTVLEIGEGAFSGCKKLSEVELSKRIAKIEKKAFQSCSALTDIYIHPSDVDIAMSADTLPTGTVIHSYEGSSANTYASSYNRTFAVLEGTKGVDGDISWQINADGELVLSGSGDMKDYKNSEAPWNADDGGYMSFDNIDTETLSSLTFTGADAFESFVASIGNASAYTMVSEGDGKYVKKAASTSATLTLVDTGDLLNSGKFMIAFDYRMDGKPNSGGILSLNDRTFGESDEMRILSTRSGVGGLYFGSSSSLCVYSFDYNTPTWLSMCVIVDPVTYDYDIFVDGKLIVHTETNESGGHVVNYQLNGVWKTGTVSGAQSPFTNVNGVIRSVYMFHYGATECSIDNLTIRSLSNVKKVTVGDGISKIGAGAFRYCTDLSEINIPLSVNSIGDAAFFMTSLDRVEVIRKDVEIFDGPQTFPVDTVLSAPRGSLLEAYAEKYSRTFEVSNANIAAGQIGTDLEWKVTGDGALTVLGTGVIPDYSVSSAPWAPYVDYVSSIVVKEGVTGIGASAFRGCDAVTDVVLPESIKTIGEYAFAGLGFDDIFLSSSIESIGRGAFSGCAALGWIELPSSIQTIEAELFDGCAALAEPTLPTTVKEIGAYAFRNCDALTRIIIPANVAKVGEGAFFGCDALMSVNFRSRSTEIYQSETTIPAGVLLYGYCGSTAETYANKYERTYVALDLLASGSLNDGLTWRLSDTGVLSISGKGSIPNYYSPSVAPWAETHRDTIKTVVIGEGVTTIGAYAFQKHAALQSVSLPDSLTNIYAGAFANCKALVSVEIPENVTKVGAYGFSNCTALTDIYILSKGTLLNPSANVLPKKTVIHCVPRALALEYVEKYERPFELILEKVAFGQSEDGLTWEVFSDGKLVISGEGAMQNYSQSARAPWYNKCVGMIETVVIEEGVTAVGAYAFQNHKVLSSISLPSTLKEIGSSGFAVCNKLTAVEIPASVTYVGSYAFYGCSGMTDIYFLSRTTGLNNGAATLPSSALIHCIAGSKVAAYAERFDRQTDEMVVLDGSGVTEDGLAWEVYSDGKLIISGEGAMQNYSQNARAPWYNKFSGMIKTVEIGEGVTGIGAYAFQNHKALSAVSLPDSLTEIGASAFAICKSLTEIEIPATAVDVCSYAFYGCTGMTDIYFLSRNTALNSGENTVPSSAVIHCIAGSKAEAYATRFGRTTEEIVVKDGSGVTDDGLTWEIFSDGRLIISGQGAMMDYSQNARAPWYNKFSGMIKTVEIQEGVTRIGAYVFQNHKAISSVSLPDTLTEIGASAFAICKNLTEIEIPASVEYIASYAFYSCSAMTDIYIFGSDTEVQMAANTLPTTTVIHGCDGSGAQAYASKFGRTFVEIPRILGEGKCGSELKWRLYEDGEMTIFGSGEMQDYTASPAPWSAYTDSIKKLVVRKSVAKIGVGAFVGCDQLSEITVEQGNAAYYSEGNCLIERNSNTLVLGCVSSVIPETVTAIGDYSFSGIEIVAVPSGVTYIGEGAFNCSTLKTISVSSDSTQIFDSASTIYAEAMILGGSDSTAEAYAEKYGREFVALCEASVAFTKNEDVVSVYGTGAMEDQKDGHAPWMDVWNGGAESFDGMTVGEVTAESFEGENFSDFTATLKTSEAFSIVEEGTNCFLSKTSDTSATLNLADDIGWLDTQKFVVSFDYRMESQANNGGILSLNNRMVGPNDEMRILSTETSSGSGNNKIVFGAPNASVVLVSNIDVSAPQWIRFCVVVDPLTNDYEIWVDGEKVLYTTYNATSEAHSVWTQKNGEWVSSSPKVSPQSPFTNIDGTIKSIYMFHYSGTACSIDNFSIRPVTEISEVTVNKGVTAIGGYAFAYLPSLKKIELAETVDYIGDSAFYVTDVDRIDILSKDAVIFDSANTLPVSATIYGYNGSTAQAYATKYSRSFVALDD